MHAASGMLAGPLRRLRPDPRNVIGERVLGLPKEPDVSRDVPFRDLEKGTQGQEARS